MDWQIRIALIIAGCALIGYIYFDFTKKKKIQKENEQLKRKFKGITDQVDSGGFDHNGVGTPRQATVEGVNELISDSNIEGTSIDTFISESENKTNLNTQEVLIESESVQIIEAPTEGDATVDASSVDEENIDPNTKQDLVESDTESEVVQTSDHSALVLSLILQASPGHQFKGRDFLPLFLSQGLRHGEMGIFHRRSKAGSKPGPVLFSLANGIAPGNFDINGLESFQTPALALFITLPGPEDSQVAYNAMYKTCILLQEELGGDILDETKSVYSKQTHNHRLDQIRDYSFKLEV